MGTEENDRAWLQVRLTNEEKLELTALAEEYNVSLSQMVRMMTAYFVERKPIISVRFAPKADAPAREVAGAL